MPHRAALLQLSGTLFVCSVMTIILVSHIVQVHRCLIEITLKLPNVFKQNFAVSREDK